MPRQLVALLQGAESPRASRRASAQNASITFAEATSLYEKAGGDGRFLLPLKKQLGHFFLDEITQEVLDRLAPAAYPDTSNSTRIRQWYGPVSAVLHCAASRGLCQHRQIKRPRLPTELRLRWIWPAEAVRLAGACWPHFRPMYYFLQHAGPQPSEAVFVDWRQIDLTQREVQFPASASAEERIVPLHPLVVAALERLSHRDGPVFRKMDHQPYKTTRRAAAAVKTAFANACDRAGIDDFTLRDVRTTWCVWELALYRDFELLMVRGGWRDQRALARLKSVSTADLDALQAAIIEQRWDSCAS